MKIKTDLVILPQLKPQLKLKITPELKEQLRLLECPAQELEKEILKELEENPFLEIDNSPEEEQESSYYERINLEDLPEHKQLEFEDHQQYEWSKDTQYSQSVEHNLAEWPDQMFNPHLQDLFEYERDLEQNIPSIETDFSIESQIESNFEGEDIKIARAIMDSLDWKGYLSIPPEEIINKLRTYGIDIDYQKFEKVRQEIMTNLDPPGIASKDWQEFFTFIVFKKTGVALTPELIEKIEKLAERYNKLLEVAFSQKDSYAQDDLAEIVASIESEMPQELQELKQKIARIPLYPLQELRAKSLLRQTYAKIDEPSEPDVEANLNPDGSFYVRIVKPYKIRITTIYDDKDLKNLRDWLKLLDKNEAQILKAKEYIRKAKIIAEGVRRRQEILLRVSREIFAVQSEFLKSGKESDINALRLADLAEKCGLSIGNVSRAIKKKYVRTPYGVFPLRKFLSSPVETNEGGKISKLKLLKTLEEIVRQEDKNNPLSDSQIAKIIKEKLGVNLSRRTIVKYRERLGIGNITERKKQCKRNQVKTI